MLMTEEEALTRWCPHARVSTLVTGTDYNETAVGGAACNRADSHSMYEGANCIAGGCMAWRWGGPIQRPKEGGWNRSDGSFETETISVGYCGAFGKPSA